MRIVTRREWGSATPTITGRTVPLSARRQHVVHWPVMSSRDERQWCRDIERIHRQGNRWPIIGYNFLVGTHGIYEGAGLANRGIHSPPVNTSGFGVCYLQPSTAAGVPTGPITPQMRTNGRQLYDWLCQQTGRRLSKTWHGATFATACPGPDLIAWVRQGMPDTLPPPQTVPPAPTPVQEVDLVGMGINRAGILHQFRVFQGSVWYRFRNRQGWSDWARFAPLPDPSATLLSVAPGPDIVGALNVALDSRTDGRSWRTWQRGGQTAWEGGQAGRQVAGFQAAGRIAA